MISRKLKSAFFYVAGPLMAANGVAYRYLRAPRHGDLRVQLGPGQQKYLDGWINLDANIFTGKCDVWVDLRNQLPFADDTITCMYSHHVVEHLPDLKNHFADVFRCLKPGGAYRVGGPNADSAIDAFYQRDSNWFEDFPDSRRSIGGRFENFIMCRREHLTILTESYLREIMEDIGFVNIERRLPKKETGYWEHFEPCLTLEYESDFERPHTLILEAAKPIRTNNGNGSKLG
jgi:predicted SAM-dependent methyltransferase